MGGREVWLRLPVCECVLSRWVHVPGSCLRLRAAAPLRRTRPIADCARPVPPPPRPSPHPCIPELLQTYDYALLRFDDGAEAAARAASAALAQRSAQSLADAKAHAEVVASSERKRKRDAAIATSLYRAFAEPDLPKEEDGERPATRSSKTNPLRRTW